MSYEQERGQSVACSDIYSLGMVALQALTGKHPSQFQRDRDNEINWRSYAKVSREFAAVLDRMTRCNPRDRYQTVDEVLKDIAKLPKLSTASPRIADDLEVKPHSPLSNLLLQSAIALLFLIGGIYLFNLLMSRAQNSSPIINNSRAILITPSVPVTPTPENLSPENKSSYNQLSIYLTEKNWKAADNETYLLLLKAAGSKSLQDGTFHPDELNRISCADIVLIDQLWKQASDGKQGLTAQKKILASFGKDIRQTYESLGWINASGELIIDTAYNRQTSRWEYIEGRQPNFKSPPVGHLPFLLRDPHKNLERMVTLYRCSP
jgi:hypothetical protein